MKEGCALPGGGLNCFYIKGAVRIPRVIQIPFPRRTQLHNKVTAGAEGREGSTFGNGLIRFEGKVHSSLPKTTVKLSHREQFLHIKKHSSKDSHTTFISSSFYLYKQYKIFESCRSNNSVY